MTSGHAAVEEWLRENVICIPGGWKNHSENSGYDVLAERLRFLGARIVEPQPHSVLARLMGRFWLQSTGLWRKRLSSYYGASMFLDERRLSSIVKKNSIVHFLSAENSFSFFRHPNIVCTFHATLRDREKYLLNKEAMKHVRAAIALTPDEAAYLRLEIKDVALIPSGINTEAFFPAKNSRLKNPGILRLAVVGSYLRDFAALERAVKANEDKKKVMEFLILGPKDETRRFSAYPHCRILPRLSYEEYLDLLQGSDALFLPLLDGAANTAVLEAMACGLPVVTNGGEGPSFYVGDAGWLYENIEEAIDILRDRNFKEQCVVRGYKARARAMEMFSWDKVVPQVVELYRRLS